MRSSVTQPPPLPLSAIESHFCNDRADRYVDYNPTFSSLYPLKHYVYYRYSHSGRPYARIHRPLHRAAHREEKNGTSTARIGPTRGGNKKNARQACPAARRTPNTLGTLVRRVGRLAARLRRLPRRHWCPNGTWRVPSLATMVLDTKSAREAHLWRRSTGWV